MPSPEVVAFADTIIDHKLRVAAVNDAQRAERDAVDRMTSAGKAMAATFNGDTAAIDAAYTEARRLAREFFSTDQAPPESDRDRVLVSLNDGAPEAQRTRLERDHFAEEAERGSVRLPWLVDTAVVDELGRRGVIVEAETPDAWARIKWEGDTGPSVAWDYWNVRLPAPDAVRVAPVRALKVEPCPGSSMSDEGIEAARHDAAVKR